MKGKIALINSIVAERLKRFKRKDVFAFFNIEGNKDPFLDFSLFW
jgi:hypothetical protein